MRLICRETNCSFAFTLDSLEAPVSRFFDLLTEHMNHKNHHKFLLIDNQNTTNTRQLVIE